MRRCGAFSTSPIEPDLARRIEAEADRQRAAIAGLRQAARCETRTLVGPDVGYATFRAAQLGVAEAKVRGDADAAMDFAELGFDLADTGDVFHSAVGAAVAGLALGTLEEIGASRPDLARRAEALGRRELDLDATLARDAVHARDLAGTIGMLWSRRAAERFAARIGEDWARNVEKAGFVATKL